MVPHDLLNRPLPSVEAERDADDIDYQVVRGGFGAGRNADWGVCSTDPVAGVVVTGGVRLIVGHFTCGGSPQGT